jgi:hypothetical protein
MSEIMCQRCQQFTTEVDQNGWCLRCARECPVGPTVVEAARMEIKAIDREILNLLDRKDAAMERLRKYRGTTVLENERVASEQLMREVVLAKEAERLLTEQKQPIGPRMREALRKVSQEIKGRQDHISPATNEGDQQ